MLVRSALQINMHPLDVHHAVHTLEHQLRQWRGQVDRVLLTVDTRPSRAGRYRGREYKLKRDQLLNHIHGLQGRYDEIHVEEVDYSDEAREAVRKRFFSTERECPEKAFDGGPFFAYFYGLLHADADYILHMDGDMLFGGGSQRWMAEAMQLLEANPSALFAGPLPGPPSADGLLSDLHRTFPGLSNICAPRRLDTPFPAFRFETVSTRVFVIDMLRFEEKVGCLDIVRPDYRRRLRARLYRQPPISMPAEEVLTAAMRRRGLNRIDFLGAGEGMYSLHPPYRSAEFYEGLPALIVRIEAGDIPNGQRGDYDVNASMVDWTSALREKTRWKRYRRALKHLVQVNLEEMKLR